jgi:hypothetical protein
MNIKKTGLGTLVLTILMVSIFLVPAVSGKANELSTTTSQDIGKIIIDNSPEIKVTKKTDTSCIVQVGDVLITYESDPKYTEANMKIKDLKTNTVSNFDYKVSTNNGKYKTDVYKEGKLVNSVTSQYNPIEPGTASKILADSAAQTNFVTASQTKYVWDGVYFIKGSGIKYNHPDYTKYNAYNYQTFYIKGNKLIHYHLSYAWSSTVSSLAGTVAGAALGARWGGAYGAAAGALLGALMGGATGQVLLDEQGCIWYWYSQSFATLYIVQLVPYLSVTKVYAPYYFRTATYTLWNLLGISNP